MVRPVPDIVRDPGVDLIRICPDQPIPVGHAQVHVHHAVQERGGHWPNDGTVLRAVSRSNHN